ncbi:MAG: DUF4270 family protein [Marinilabiliaceae bacterium]|nr:DUF4270 family protein [Marinilabiliaceae bacterium]
MRNIISFITFSLVLFIAFACSDEDFVMSRSFINSNTYSEQTEEVAIELATFKLDSVLTSSQNTAWVGRCKKPIIGNIVSESFVKIGMPAFVEWERKERYDSVEFILRHTGAYEGDTMKEMTIDIHRLAQPIRFAESETYFYNKREFRDSISIGKYTFKPRPKSRPRVHFLLNDEFGQELVSFIKNVTVMGTSVEKSFEAMLGGIKLTAGDESQSLLAFRADSVKIILHSHISGLERKKIKRIFSITENEKQFNRVWNEEVETPFDRLTSRTVQVKESECDSLRHSPTFEGLGYYTRINFPSLEDVVNRTQYAHVVKATLTLCVEKGSFDKYRIPNTFYLTEVNRFNVLGNFVIDNSRSVARAQVYRNILDESQLYYTFDLTYYINSRLSQGYIEPTDGLVLTWGSGMSPTNYDFMVFNGHGVMENRSKLDITYYYYDRIDR